MLCTSVAVLVVPSSSSSLNTSIHSPCIPPSTAAHTQVLPSFVAPSMLSRLQGDMEHEIDALATRLYKRGKIGGLYAELDWTSRLLRITKDFKDAPMVLIKGKKRNRLSE